jgi:hypothetical protein
LVEPKVIAVEGSSTVAAFFWPVKDVCGSLRSTVNGARSTAPTAPAGDLARTSTTCLPAARSG